MNRRAIIASLGALSLSAAGAVALSRLDGKNRSEGGRGRLVSLAPAITETLLALNAADQLVAVSNFCQLPSGLNLPRIGSSLTPSFEAIARLRPSLILCDDSAGSKQRELAALARVQILPWLTLDEVTASMQRLGQLVGQSLAGDALSQRIRTRLSRKPAVDAPRALLLLSYDPARPAELWFIRRNSLHGAALMASGCWNAVLHDVAGLPKLSVEELIQLDPHFVLMIPPPRASLEHKKSMLEAFHALAPLEAVKQDRLGVVNGTASVGPSILEFTNELTELIRRLSGPHAVGGVIQ